MILISLNLEDFSKIVTIGSTVYKKVDLKNSELKQSRNK